MEVNGKYIQYSKVFTGIAGVAYLIQVIAMIVLVCLCNYAADALLEILGTTTGLVGVIYGCYTGNSATEKVIRSKSTSVTTTTQKTTSG